MDKPPGEIGVLRKAYDIGPGDDFYARYLFGLGNIRSCALGKDKQLEYDKSFHPVFQNLVEMRMAKDKCSTIIATHIQAIRDGKDGKFHGTQIDVSQPIDDELSLMFKDFFIRGQMAVEALIRHAGYLGYNIGFLFTGNDKRFRSGLRNFALKEDDDRFHALSDFVANHKTAWYSSFREMRRKIEHDGWSLPQLKYTLDKKLQVRVHLPTAPKQTLEELLQAYWENMTNFCEETTVFLLSNKLKDYMVIVYLPPEHRDKNTPVRYIVSHKDMPGIPMQCG